MYTVATYLIARYCSMIVLIYYVDLFAEYLLACIADHDFYNIIRSTANIHICDRICENMHSSRIHFFNFEHS